MFNIEQFRKYIIVPSLSKLQLYSNDAEELLVFTCAVESRGGTYLKQIKGPALGIYQMEDATYNDIWQRYIRFQNSLSMMLGLNFNASRMPEQDRMIYDLEFATAMARIHYLRVKEPLPKYDDVEAIWAYYKQYYNTVLGKSKKTESIKAYHAFLES